MTVPRVPSLYSKEYIPQKRSKHLISQNLHDMFNLSFLYLFHPQHPFLKAIYMIMGEKWKDNHFPNQIQYGPFIKRLKKNNSKPWVFTQKQKKPWR